MKNNNILLLGSSGFIGQYLSRFLQSRGIVVTEFDIKNSPTQDARFAKLPLKGVDTVLFLAWDVGGSKYLYKESTQVNQMQWNVELMLNVFRQIKASKKEFLFTSSQLAEEIDTVYGVTKRLGEVWTKILGGKIIRFWNIYGSIEDEGQRSHVVSDLVKQAINTKNINLMTDGQEERQFIHVEDACKGILSALEAKSGSVYDITTFEWMKVIDLAKIIAKYTDAKIIPSSKKGRTPITPHAKKLPSWEAEITLDQGIKKMINAV